jgi:asparagine synthase (glutamine-hydrolysing)
MADSLQHRGPDGAGYFEDERMSLGSRRLSIIDLPTGSQPISNEDGSVHVVFNGEIYNFVELRRELEEAGHSFKTESDTETIVHGYEQWGARFVERLQGMFAFALWDTNKKVLHLARDRFGKKPLYYAWVGGRFAFASEIKALLQCDEFDRTLDRESLRLYLELSYVPSPRTLFSKVKKVPPGESLVLHGLEARTTSYWTMRFDPDNGKSEEWWIDALYETLRRAVGIRLRSDVPLGSFLSGGIDSSAVAALMSSATDAGIDTFSIGFEEEAFSELQYARIVADHLRSRHHEFVVSPDAMDDLPRLAWWFDEPLGDTSIIPTYYLSRETRRHVTVALSGDGGDEMFAGYGFLTDPRVFSYYSRVPRTLRRPTMKLVSRLPLDNNVVNLASAAEKADYGKQDPTQRYCLRVLSAGQDMPAVMIDRQSARGGDDPAYRYLMEKVMKGSSADPMSSVTYATIYSYMSEDILVKVDRASMAWSLEVRSPFLDQQLAQLVGRMPSSLRLHEGVTKYILKRMLLKHSVLPREIIDRKKKGFGAPVSYWFKKDWKPVVSALQESRNGIFSLVSRDYISKLAKRPKTNGTRLFQFLMLALWHRAFIDDAATKDSLKSLDYFLN